MFPVNCYVLWDDTLEAAVIDPGCYYEEEKQALKNFIHKNGLNVKHLLNTHLHLDHIFGNAFMVKEFFFEIVFQIIHHGLILERHGFICQLTTFQADQSVWHSIVLLG